VLSIGHGETKHDRSPLQILLLHILLRVVFPAGELVSVRVAVGAEW